MKNAITIHFIIQFLKKYSLTNTSEKGLQIFLLVSDNVAKNLRTGRTLWVREDSWAKGIISDMENIFNEISARAKRYHSRWSSQVSPTHEKNALEKAFDEYMQRGVSRYPWLSEFFKPLFCTPPSYTVPSFTFMLRNYIYLQLTTISSENKWNCKDDLANFMAEEGIPGHVIADFQENISNDNYAIARFLASQAFHNNIKNKENKSAKHISSDSIQLLGYDDLIDRGLTAEKISENLVQNDYALYDISPVNEGDSALWAQFLSKYKETFRYLVDSENRIQGNWSFLWLTPYLEQKLINGTLLESEISIQDAGYPLCGEYSLYLLNLSCNKEYNDPKYYQILMDELWNQLYAYAQRGIFARYMYYAIYLSEHEALWREMGFRHLIDNTDHAHIYQLEMSPFPSSLKATQKTILDKLKALYDEHFTHRFEQLHNGQHLSRQELEDIASLIYDTDPYIYKDALFRSKEQALRILPTILDEGNDAMFNLDNLFVARSGDRIVGLLLWNIGPLNWKNYLLLSGLEEDDETVSEHFDLVKREYFDSYNQTASDVIAIINFCVFPSARRRGIGRQLMNAFISAHPDQDMELFVLTESKSAIRLYTDAGFNISRELPGFAIDSKPSCLQMYRTKETVNRTIS